MSDDDGKEGWPATRQRASTENPKSRNPSLARAIERKEKVKMEPQWWPVELIRHRTKASSSNRKEQSREGTEAEEAEAEEEPGTSIRPKTLAESRPESVHLSHITGLLAWIEVGGLYS